MEDPEMSENHPPSECNRSMPPTTHSSADDPQKPSASVAATTTLRPPPPPPPLLSLTPDKRKAAPAQQPLNPVGAGHQPKSSAARKLRRIDEASAEAVAFSPPAVVPKKTELKVQDLNDRIKQLVADPRVLRLVREYTHTS